MFYLDFYHTSVETEHQGGDLVLGVRNDTYRSANWCIMGFFQLEYNGEIGNIPVEVFECYTDNVHLLTGGKALLRTYIYPMSATYTDVFWATSNPDVAVVSEAGVITATGSGTCTITGYCDDKTVTVSVTVDDDSLIEWTDYTDRITNADFSSQNKGWLCERYSSGNYGYNFDYGAGEMWNSAFRFYQTIKDLPEGYYRVSCSGYFRPENSPQDAYWNRDYNTHFAMLYAGDNQTPLQNIVDELFYEYPPYGRYLSCYDDDYNIFYAPDNMEAASWCFRNGHYTDNFVTTYHPGGDLEIGLLLEDNVQGNWAIWDDFRLEYGQMRQWTDVTDRTLQNPAFDGNSRDGWQYECSNKIDVQYNALEFYDGTFDIWQTVQAAPAGRYRLSAQAYYRAGSNNKAYAAHSNGEEDITAVLYINDKSTPIHSVYAYHHEEAMNGDYQNDGVYYPNNMAGGSASFAEGHYPVSIEIDHPGGDLRIGVRNDRHISQDWCMMDNFCLEYYGTMPDNTVQWFECSPTNLHLLPGYSKAITATYYPNNAENAYITWSSSNTTVATVSDNGIVTAVGAGNCTVTATCSGFEAQIEVQVENTDGMGWLDITAYHIVNADVERAYEGWMCDRSGGNYNYTYGSAELWNNIFDFYQTIDLEPGIYRFSCQAYDNKQSDPTLLYFGSETSPIGPMNRTDINEAAQEGGSTYYGYIFNNDDDIIPLYRPTNFQGAAWYMDNGYYGGNEVIAWHNGGEVQLGMRADVMITERWVVFDNFRLERLVTVVPVTSIALEAGSTSLIPGEQLQLTATIEPDDATYHDLIWSSSDEDVLTVDKNGMVTAVSLGTATVTATSRDFNAVSTSVEITVSYGTADPHDLVINEVMSMNVDQFLDPSWNYGGWIELYNPTDGAISLVDCYITEDPANPMQHKLRNAGVIPAHGYYTIWFDHFSENIYPTQVDFKLSTTGDWVAITSPTGEVLTEVTYPAGVQRCSWARTTDGGEEWGITAQPTPGTTNNTSSFAAKRISAPTVDVPAHIYDDEMITVHASWPEGSTLRYTVDGSTPTATNGATSEDGTFNISGTVTLRLVAIQDGMLPSAVTTNTYVKREIDYTIPVLFVSGNDDDFFSDERGIFVRGTNGLAGEGTGQKWNVYQDWDRPCTFEYFAPTGERLFCQDVDVTPAGGWTRTTNYGFLHTSFKLKASKVYDGTKSMDHPFFDAKPFLKHKALQIRNGGNDHSRFQDIALQQIVARSGLYIDYQEYQPVMHYINGRYGYLFNMREPNNKHHAYANYGLDTDSLDQFELSNDRYNQKEGTRDAFDRWCQLAEKCADPEVYRTICDECVDIDEFINYMAVCVWLGNNDWMTNTNNIKAYRSTASTGDPRFHFILFDLDQAFSTTNLLQQIEAMPDHNEEVAKLWKDMLQNDDFRKKFADTFSLVCGSVFAPEHCETVLTEMYNKALPMMEVNGESSRLNNQYNDLMNKLGGYGSRRYTMMSRLADYPRFYNETATPVYVTISADIDNVQMLYNGMDIPTGKFDGTACLPVTVEAAHVPGYDFAGWVKKGTDVSKTFFQDDDTWNYYDKGSLDGQNWMNPSYDDATWANAHTPMGYGCSWTTTEFDYGTPNNRRPTYYMRRSFTIDATPQDDTSIKLRYYLVGGTRVYINGTEVLRHNLPDGDVDYNTYATSSNQGYFYITIPNEVLKKGNNTIAVELHNFSANNNAISWEATLYKETSINEIVSNSTQLELDEAYNNLELVATYTKHETFDNDPVLPPVRINEVSAQNETYANEYFKRNDWLELYNTTDDEIDVAGMYLSDNLDKPQKWQIPTQLESGVSTIIPAHGHIIVWCDKLTPVSQLHASFKLSADDGSCVTLNAADGSWYDYLPYPAHDRDHTVGRYPDGSDDIYLMNIATPAATNRMSSYTAAFEYEPLPVRIDDTETTDKANGLVLRFDGQQLVASQPASIEVYSTGGEMLMTVDNARTVGLGALRTGIYVARAKANGHTATVKFSKGVNK